MRLARTGSPLVAAIVVVDQCTKLAAVQRMRVPRNPALAFGVGGGSAPMLVALAIVVLAVFSAAVGHAAVRLGIPRAIPALVVGGALANIVDRVRFGAVRDFIALPGVTVNVADLAIASGIVALGAALLVRVVAVERARELPHR
jgi:lipoprotein signal peptidase